MRIFYASFFLLLFFRQAMALDIAPKQNPDTGLLSWLAEDPRMSLELVQVPSEYVAALFSSRGLPAKIIDTLDGYCVFGTIIKNKTAGQMHYRVADWHYVTADGKKHKMKTKTDWVQQWKALGVPYRWLMLVDSAVFEEGDWIQGFSTFKLPPEAVFTLHYSWRHQGETHQRTLENLRCSPLRAPKLQNGG